ncbi:MAG TPA: hypothetical protein VG275_05840 [Solirubrobacteraceae bacterium]|nr:hypothetical protein [Solirubrobacteraceae bacterium]
MHRGLWKRGFAPEGLAAAFIATAIGVGVAAASIPAAYCSAIPAVNVPREAWGFHGGQPITGATGSYTRGHGTINLTTGTTTGIICQVDRVLGAPDRQIITSVGHHLVYASHTAVMFGVPGNIMKIDVRVTSTTDPKCPVGTRGEATVFASYNNVHEDSIQFAFPAACRRHRHRYTGPSVIANVPPN